MFSGNSCVEVDFKATIRLLSASLSIDNLNAESAFLKRLFSIQILVWIFAWKIFLFFVCKNFLFYGGYIVLTSEVKETLWQYIAKM
jgi:hypothetical protein